VKSTYHEAPHCAVFSKLTKNLGDHIARKRQLWRLSIDGRIILKEVLDKYAVKGWIKFN
jgi:hypothetical protein